MSQRVIFFGTPAIAVSCLQALIDANIDVVAVVTKPDKPIGRKKQITESDVKIFAKQHKILVLQPNKVNEIVDVLIKMSPDLFIVCAFGQLISERVLKVPKFGCVNIHTSLLPRWRGGAPIHHAVLHGDKYTGISLMYMIKELDAGNIIYQKQVEIQPTETYRTLHDKLAKLAYGILHNKINSLFSKNVLSVPQDSNKVTIAQNITRADEKINWNKTVKQVDAQIRGLYDKPIAYTIYDDLWIKIHQAVPTTESSLSTPGSIIRIDDQGLYVVCGDQKVLKVIYLQIPGKKVIHVKDLIHGRHCFKIGKSFTY